MGITEILIRIWLFSANKIKSSESFSKQPTQLIVDPNHGKYREWNGNTFEISCWADLAQPSAGIKNSPKNLCGHVIFIVFFKLQIEIAGGDGDGTNQFILKIQAF